MPIVKPMALLAGALLTIPCAAADNEVLLDHAWALATPIGVRAASAYLHIANRSNADDRIVAVSSPIAAEVSVHRSMEENGVARMDALDGLDVKARGEATLKPGGAHIMLMSLFHPLRPGESFPLILTFEHAGKIETRVDVMAIKP